MNHINHLAELQKRLADESAYNIGLKIVIGLIGLEYVDKRDKGGALWVLGDESLKDVMKLLADHGARFKYHSNGGKATGNRPSWSINAGEGDPLIDEPCQVIEKYGVLSEGKRCVCFNLVKWYHNEPAFDIREWDSIKCEKSGKGVTLSKEELKILVGSIDENTIASHDELLEIFKLKKGTVDDYGLIAVLNDKGKWHTEARVADWGYFKGLDIRNWEPNHTACGKGITLKEDELRELVKILRNMDL